MIDTLSKIAQGKFSKTEHSNMLSEKEEHSLKLYALKILTSIVSRLNQFLSEEQKDVGEEVKQQNSGGFKNEADEDEEQSPHYMQNSSITDTSMSVDPKKDNYERSRLLKSNIYKAANKFNLKPKKGIEYLLEFNNAKDLPYDEKVDLILNFIRTTPTVNMTAIGDYIGEDIQINKDVLYRMVDTTDFKNIDIVSSIRLLLSFFRLPGEGQKVDRIMEKFGEKYVKDNPDTVGDAE